jgi:hypothetical protein
MAVRASFFRNFEVCFLGNYLTDLAAKLCQQISVIDIFISKWSHNEQVLRLLSLSRSPFPLKRHKVPQGTQYRLLYSLAELPSLEEAVRKFNSEMIVSK